MKQVKDDDLPNTIGNDVSHNKSNMKYIIHIKLPLSTSQDEASKVREEAKEMFDPNHYIVIVTAGDIDIQVLPKWAYSVKLFWYTFVYRIKVIWKKVSIFFSNKWWSQ